MKLFYLCLIWFITIQSFAIGDERKRNITDPTPLLTDLELLRLCESSPACRKLRPKLPQWQSTEDRRLEQILDNLEHIEQKLR